MTSKLILFNRIVAAALCWPAPNTDTVLARSKVYLYTHLIFLFSNFSGTCNLNSPWAFETYWAPSVTVHWWHDPWVQENTLRKYVSGKWTVPLSLIPEIPHCTPSLIPPKSLKNLDLVSHSFFVRKLVVSKELEQTNQALWQPGESALKAQGLTT